jgi:energy-coupling factor transporter ATP-binding protein EcfA2
MSNLVVERVSPHVPGQLFLLRLKSGSSRGGRQNVAVDELLALRPLLKMLLE